MTFGELKDAIVEAIGEEVVTPDKLIAGVRSGFGDMVHRGYREFEHIFLLTKPLTEEEEVEGQSYFDLYLPGMCGLDFPTNALEILYVKLYFGSKSYLATKVALTNPAVQAVVKNEQFKTDFSLLDYERSPEVIYYKKAKSIFVEWDYEQVNFDTEEPFAIEVGYYKNLPLISKTKLREYAKIPSDEVLDIVNTEIPIGDDYANVLVNFMIWYVALSQDWEQERLTVLKNEYKYSMEDLLARKGKEDMYDETTNIQKIDGEM